MPRTVRDLLFGDEDIYAGFPIHEHPLDRHTWGGRSPIFSRLIAELRPGRIIEVGSWLGWSAISMARACRRHGVDCDEIVCVDTWLGNDRHIIAVDAAGTIHQSSVSPLLRRHHGYPRLYETFLANVIHTGCQDLITPFPASSDVAASVLRTIALPADLIYIDANHTYESVSADLATWWPLISPGGVLMAHDYTPSFPGSVRAIDEFSERHRLQRYLHRDWCFMVKDFPPAGA